MSLEKIRDIVMRASTSEADRINSAAEKDAGERLEARKENLLRELEHQFQLASRQIEGEYSRKFAVFQGNRGKELLEAKNAALRSILDRAHNAVLLWSEEEYGTVMKRFLHKITIGRKGYVRVHADDRVLFESLIQGINNGRSDQTRIAVDEEYLHDKGGFIFISEDFEVDATLGTIFSDIERSILPYIAEELSRI